MDDDDNIPNIDDEYANHIQFKVLVVGDPNVGKTAIVGRYSQGIFSNTYKSTIGADFALKRIRWNDKTEITLQFWDLCGQERFGTQVTAYFRGAKGVIYVYSLEDERSKSAVNKWKDSVDSKASENGTDCNIPSIVLANKVDLLDEVPKQDEIDEYWRTRDHKGGFISSAAKNIGLDEALKLLIMHMIENNKNKLSEDAIVTEIVDLTCKVDEKSQKCWC
jgi:small GTP-binding protein